MVLLISGSAYAQSSADANAQQGQQQSQVGGVGTASSGANAQQSQGIFIGTGGNGGVGAQGGPSASSIMGGGAAATGGSGGNSVAVSGGGKGGSVSNSGNAMFSNSFNGAKPIRYLPVPAALPIENYQPSIFGRADYADKGPNFISMRQLVYAMNYVDLTADVEGERSIEVVTQMMVPLPDGHPRKVEPSKAKVVFEINDGDAVNSGFKPIAVLTVRTKRPDKSNSASLAIQIGRLAQHMKATHVVFLTEGSSKEMQSSGWGIGFSYNYASVNSDPNGNGSVGSGGFGYSQGKAGYKDLIYLTAIVGVRK